MQLILFFIWLAIAVVSLTAVILTLTTVYIYLVRRKYAHLPSPKLPSVFFGHVPDIFRMQRESGNASLSFTHVCEYWMKSANSNTIVVFFFHQTRVLTADPAVVKMIAMDSSHGKSTTFMQVLRDLYGQRFLGSSILMVPDYKSWIPRKKIMDPVFTKQYLQGLVPKFNSIIDRKLEDLKSLIDGHTSIQLESHIRTFVLTIVSECLFNVSYSKLCETAAKYLEVPVRFKSGEFKEPLIYLLWRNNEGITKALTSPCPNLAKYYSPFETKEFRDAIYAGRATCHDIMLDRIKAMESGEDTPLDVLSQILQMGVTKGLEMEELVDNIYNFLGAGSDTTMHMFQFTIILLTKHPEIMRRVIEEINEVLGERTEVTIEDIEKLTYIEQVLYESLRVHPIVIAGGVKCLHSDLNIKGGYTIPAHSTVMLMSSVIARNSEYFEDPEVFNPDRFAPATRPDAFTFFPFGIGHRACIGKHFALIEAKMFLARFFQTFTVSLPEDFQLEIIQDGLTLKPRDGLNCTLIPVTNNSQ